MKGFSTNKGLKMENYERNSKKSLSFQEKKVLELVVKGKTNQEIANELYISVHTVKAHIQHILKKLSVKSRIQAAVKATSEKIL